MDGQAGGSSGPVQFSLRTIFVVTTIVGVLCGLLIGGSPIVRWCTGFALVLLLPVLWTVMIIYGRGYQRTFAIGAMFPCGILFVAVGTALFFIALGILSNPPAPSWNEFRDYVANSAKGLACVAEFNLLLSILFGVVAALLRWVIEPRR